MSPFLKIYRATVTRGVFRARSRGFSVEQQDEQEKYPGDRLISERLGGTSRSIRPCDFSRIRLSSHPGVRIRYQILGKGLVWLHNLMSQ